MKPAQATQAATGTRARRPLLRLPLADPLLRSASALVLSTVIAGVLGIAYWIVAARNYPERTVGQESAALSAMLMLSNFAQGNLFHGLTRFVPAAGRRTARLVAWSYAGTCAAAVVLGTAFVLLAPLISPDLTFVRSSTLTGMAFVAAVTLWVVFALQDGVLTALRRPSWVPIENAIFGVVKLVLLLVFASVLVDGGIFASWNVPVLFAVIPVTILIFRRLIPAGAASAQATPELRAREVARFVAIDYASGLLLQTYTTALPLLIVAKLGPEANAQFYVAYVFIAALDLVSVNIGTSLMVEGAHDEARLAEYTRRVLRRGGPLIVAAVVGVLAAASLVPSVFGHQYATDAPQVLRLLVLGSLPRMLGILYMAVMRVERRVDRIVAVQGATSVLVIGLSFVLSPRLGVEGVAVAWTCAHLTVAVALLPWLRRQLRTPSVEHTR